MKKFHRLHEVPYIIQENNHGIKAKAVASLNNGEVIFTVKCEVSTLNAAMERIKYMISREFDYCHNANEWKTITVTFERHSMEGEISYPLR